MNLAVNFADIVLLQNIVSKMQRDMKELEQKAAASARAALSEKEHSLQLEEDLKKVCAELEEVKKEAAHTKKIAEKSVHDLNVGLDRCHKGIRAMNQFIFGKQYSSILSPYLTPLNK